MKSSHCLLLNASCTEESICPTGNWGFCSVFDTIIWYGRILPLFSTVLAIPPVASIAIVILLPLKKAIVRSNLWISGILYRDWGQSNVNFHIDKFRRFAFFQRRDEVGIWATFLAYFMLRMSNNLSLFFKKMTLNTVFYQQLWT